MERIVIGLVGAMRSGKGEFSQFLKEKGFAHFSLADRVREEVQKRGLEPKRETLQNVGNSLRREFGNDILARKTAEMITATDRPLIVIDSLRHPAEVQFVREAFQAIIVGITASKEVRLERYLASPNELDPKTPEAFYKVSAKDLGEKEESYGQHVEACLQMADVTIENNRGVEELREKGERLLRERFGFSPEGARATKETI